MSYAKERRLHGQWIHPAPSSFLREIPSKLLSKTRTVEQQGTGRYNNYGNPYGNQSWDNSRRRGR